MALYILQIIALGSLFCFNNASTIYNIEGWQVVGTICSAIKNVPPDVGSYNPICGEGYVLWYFAVYVYCNDLQLGALYKLIKGFIIR